MQHFKVIVCLIVVFPVFLVATNLYAFGTGSSTAGNPTNKCYYRQLEGSIGTAKVEMVLYQFDDFLSGSYIYTKYGEKISLQSPTDDANIDKEGFFTLNEYAYIKNEETHTGAFKGKLLTDGRISGIWESADGKKSFPFELKDIPLTDSAEIGIEFYVYPFCVVIEESIDTVIKNKSVTIKQKVSKLDLEDKYELPVLTKLPNGNHDHLNQINNAISQVVFRDAQSSEERQGKTIVVDFSAPTEPGDEIEIIENKKSVSILLNKYNLYSIIIEDWEFHPFIPRAFLTCSALNFNLKTGSEIAFDDVFKTGSEEKVYKIASDELKSYFPDYYEDYNNYISVKHFAITNSEIYFIDAG
ncbi:hypothetical protein C7N43_26050 [Sphingobacteriales bacterium UPWRP_1]|nr:hypothetical protein BVG80_17855 [Sphingobacteriales bacterium TSM_CSM]PSJ74059.1 hypothetical protein C7N43_26050 [Sphingobacteriales bacterium UPWRP_1]